MTFFLSLLINNNSEVKLGHTTVTVGAFSGSIFELSIGSIFECANDCSVF